MDLTAKQVLASDDVLVRELQGESVLLDLASESYFGLDEIGTAMWDALMRHATVEGALAELAAGYDVEPTELRADLEGFVAELAQSGLVDVRAIPD